MEAGKTTFLGFFLGFLQKKVSWLNKNYNKNVFSVSCPKSNGTDGNHSILLKKLVVSNQNMDMLKFTKRSGKYKTRKHLFSLHSVNSGNKKTMIVPILPTPLPPYLKTNNAQCAWLFQKQKWKQWKYTYLALNPNPHQTTNLRQ